MPRVFKIQIYILFFIFLVCQSSSLYPETTNDSRIPIAVLDFEPKGAVDPQTADFVTERIRIEMFRTGKYKILERHDMKKILDEKKLELSGLSGSEYAIKIGEFLSARKIMLGSVTLIDSKYYINMRIVEVQSGIMDYGDTGTSESISGLSPLCYGLVNRMEGGTLTPQKEIRENGFSIDNTIDYFLEKIHVLVNKDADNNSQPIETIQNAQAGQNTAGSQKVEKPKPLNNKTSIPLFYLLSGEIAGLCLPGSGLAHFIVGDTGTGFTILGATAISAGVAAGTYYSVKNGYLKDKTVSYCLYGAAAAVVLTVYLCDIIGAPLYFFNNNRQAAAGSMQAPDPLSLNNDIGIGLTVFKSTF